MASPRSSPRSREAPDIAHELSKTGLRDGILDAAEPRHARHRRSNAGQVLQARTGAAEKVSDREPRVRLFEVWTTYVKGVVTLDGGGDAHDPRALVYKLHVV